VWLHVLNLLGAKVLSLLMRTSAIRAVQVYRRLRGTLFFGSGFAVTKNKLTFCDALDQILAEAKPGAVTPTAESRSRSKMQLHEIGHVWCCSMNSGWSSIAASEFAGHASCAPACPHAQQEGVIHDLAGEPGMEKAFGEWLQRCHAELDKSLRFEELAEPEAQAAARRKAGVTLFRRSFLDPI